MSTDGEVSDTYLPSEPSPEPTPSRTRSRYNMRGPTGRRKPDRYGEYSRSVNLVNDRTQITSALQTVAESLRMMTQSMYLAN